MPETLTLAQFSDIHLPPLPGFTPRYWNLKRALGLANWHRQRKFIHKQEIADALIADAQSLRASHIAITGDLISLGLPAEYERAKMWLDTVGDSGKVTVVPGNHDIYSALHGDTGVARWAPYMGAEEGTLAFPFLRRLGPVALIGLNSAVETPPFAASGRLGFEQIEIAAEMLDRLRDENVFRVVLIHHPPLLLPARQRTGLRDAAHLLRMLDKKGAELVLYGHTHRQRLDWLGFGPHAVPAIGAASSSAMLQHKQQPIGRYNLFTFFRGPEGARIRHSVRGFESPGGAIVPLSEDVLTPPPA